MARSATGMSVCDFSLDLSQVSSLQIVSFSLHYHDAGLLFNIKNLMPSIPVSKQRTATENKILNEYIWMRNQTQELFYRSKHHIFCTNRIQTNKTCGNKTKGEFKLLNYAHKPISNVDGQEKGFLLVSSQLKLQIPQMLLADKTTF